MRQTCPVKSLTLVVLGWDWVPFLPWNPAKMLLRLGNVHFYYVYYHFSVPWPNSLEQTTAWKLPLHPRVNFQKKSRKSREKWEIFHCRICTKSITTHKIFPYFQVPLCGTEKKDFLVLAITKDAPAPKLHFQLDCSKMVNKMVNFSL